MSVTIFNYHERTEMYFNVRIDEKLAGSVIDTMYTFFIAQLNLIYPVRGSKDGVKPEQRTSHHHNTRTREDDNEHEIRLKVFIRLFSIKKTS